MNQKILPLVSAAVGLCAFLLTYQYLKGKEREVADKIRELSRATATIEVVAATRDIPGGTKIKEDDLKLISMTEATAPDQVVRKNEGRLILGRKTLFQVKANRPILWSEVEGGDPMALGLAPIVKPGMRALSLAIGGAAAVSGIVQPNDRVDVLGTFSLPSRTVAGDMESVSLTVLQDVTVLATGQQLARDQAASRAQPGVRAGGYSTVTLEVTPREAELLVFAQQMQGRLMLTLRDPTDITFERELPEVNFKMVESELSALNLERQRTIRNKVAP